MKKIRSIVVMITLLIFSFISVFESYPSVSAEDTDSIQATGISADEYVDISSYSYYDYLKDNSDKTENSNESIVIQAIDFETADMPEMEIKEDSIITSITGSVQYKVDIEKTGWYNIKVDYYPVKGSNASIVRQLKIDDTYLFSEMEKIIFERLWIDENKDFLMNTDGNQAAPKQIEAPEWQTKTLESSDKKYTEPFKFYLERGEHTLEFISYKEPMQMGDITLCPAESLPTYEEYYNSALDEGTAVVTEENMPNGPVTVQGEDAYSKTTSVLIPVNDRTSAKTQPYHYSNIVMNAIGGENWVYPGDGITWSINVPTEGFYKIALRFKQSYNRDFFSLREVKINGEVPFAEAAEVKFNYMPEYQLSYLGNGTQEYYFKLNEGENRISLTVALGELGQVITKGETVVKNFNDLYRRLVAIMGTNPDEYRDYNITALLPDMMNIIVTEQGRLLEILDDLGETMEAGAKTKEVSTLLYQIEDIIEKPDNIAKELSSFSENISALSSWTASLGDQYLLVDYIMICPDKYELPAAEGNFYENLKHTIMSFIGSFTNDYIVHTGDNKEYKKEIEVWIASTARDQYDIVQRMINEQYKDSDVHVTLKMVTADSITPSTITGNGPDVAIQINSSMPTNFAFRGAAYDLTNFDDFEEVSSQFSPASMEYFEYQGGYYALPDQMSFPVMFFRTDIFSQLGLTVPNTWDELIGITPYLQSKNMDIYFETTSPPTLGGASSTSTKAVNNIYLSLLYQSGERLYSENGEYVNLDTEKALSAFKYWTEFYTKHSFEVTMDFVTRFRTGEVPLAIVDYTYYNNLMAAAPEIQGDWSIAPIPGTVKEDGSIDRSVSSTVGAAMIIKETVERNHTEQVAWDFLKWWVGEDAQVEYANSQESILGPAARYPVANLSAIDKLAWEPDALETVNITVENMCSVPQVPGSYITGRYVETAFLSVVNDNIDPIDTLYKQIRFINDELTNKRMEFGLEERK